MLSKKILKLHHRSTVVDGHADTFSKLLNTDIDFFKRTLTIPRKHTTRIPHDYPGKRILQIDYPRLKQGGTDLQFMAICTPPIFTSLKATDYTLRMIARMNDVIDAGQGKIIFILTKKDLKLITQKKHNKPLGFLISIESGLPLAGRLDFLEMFYSLGVRALGLTHNPRNELGDGIGVSKPRGLTAFGKKTIKEMDRLGMVIDVAHLAKPGFQDVARLARGPIISSHTGVRALRNIPRNLDDDQIKEIARRRGVVCIFHIPEYLTANKKKAGIQTVVDHMQYVADKFGVDYVGLGSDFDGYNGDLPGLKDATTVPKITVELVRRGFNDTEVRKILGGNFLRVLKTVLK